MDKKLGYSHKMKHYLAIKRNEVLIPDKTWMNHRNIILTERSQSQNTSYDTFYMKFPEKQIYIY